MDSAALAALRNTELDWRFKGFPPARGVTVDQVASQGWSLLARDLPTPVLLLKESALEHNLQLMHGYCAERGASLAPHGKTTMSPELIARQLAAGAWGITAANTAQVRVFRAFGIERILLANEIVELGAVRWVAAELARDPGFDFYCLADSLAAVSALERGLADTSAGRPINVLVELGISGGRTGARSVDDAVEVASAIAASPVLRLAGVEGFEGIIHGDDGADVLARVDEFLGHLRYLANSVFPVGHGELIVTAGGSAFFDRVCERLGPALADGSPFRLVLRSGCYLTHDSGFYEHVSPLGGRAPNGERLRPALEAWGAVLSRPEPELALLLLGKRDVSHDIGFPYPERILAAGGLRSATAMEITELNDQHAFLRLPADDPLAVGDLVGCGISHPCTTFDKWRLIPVVDDAYTVIDAVHTFF
jgi:D-serine deaminase-like pyridoxal phosphate-dependent protein